MQSQAGGWPGGLRLGARESTDGPGTGSLGEGGDNAPAAGERSGRRWQMPRDWRHLDQRSCSVAVIKVAEPRPTSSTHLPNQLTQPLAVTVESQMDPSSEAQFSGLGPVHGRTALVGPYAELLRLSKLC